MRILALATATIVALCSSVFAAEVTETPTRGFIATITTSAGEFVRCTEYGHWPKCNGETELPHTGGLAHQVVRTPKGKVIEAFPALQYMDDFVSDIVEAKDGIYMLAGHSLYRYDAGSDTFVLAYSNRSFRISMASVTGEPYFALSEGRGRSMFEGLLTPDTSGKWQVFTYDGPRLPDVEKVEVEGGIVVLKHYAEYGSTNQPAVTKFDPAAGTFATR
jgi:hypothetical protein